MNEYMPHTKKESWREKDALPVVNSNSVVVSMQPVAVVVVSTCSFGTHSGSSLAISPSQQEEGKEGWMQSGEAKAREGSRIKRKTGRGDGASG